MTTSRIVVQDHLERQGTCLPCECPRVQASVEIEMESELSEPEESQED